jgi:hypothetical protein
VDQIGERVSRRLRPTTSKPGEAGEHGLRLDEVDIVDLAAVAAVPAERRPLEPGRLRPKQEEKELERVRKPDVRELGSRGERDRRVVAVQRAAEAAVSGAPARSRTHVRMTRLPRKPLPVRGRTLDT